MDLVHQVSVNNGLASEMSTIFPKVHDAFVTDKSAQAQIKTIEDRIEQSYQVHQMTQSLTAIVDIIEPERLAPLPRSEVPQEMPPELLDSMRILLQDAVVPEHLRQLNIDRDAITEMVKRGGQRYVLGLLSHRMLSSLEVLFAGVVIGYIQMFEGADGRSKIDKKRFFNGDDELERAHQKFDVLRNKQYAHKEFEFDRHQIRYAVDNSGAIAIDLGAPHEAKHFHLNSSVELLRLLRAVEIHLSKEINERSVALVKRLTDEQKRVLLDHAGQTGRLHGEDII